MTTAPATTATRPAADVAHPGLRFGQFVAFIAALMAVNALGIDIMLPALPAISTALHITIENQRQFVIAAYVFGFGSAQLIYGPLSDRFGRRPVLLSGLAAMVAMTFAVTLATDFTSIVIARLLQGVAAAASRVLAVSIVRDCYAGRQMARVMSLSFIVFLAVPILAPSFGQLIMLFGPWQWIFYLLGGFAALVGLIGWRTLPETLHPRDRRSIHPGAIGRAALAVVTNRLSLGYTLASTLLTAGLMGYINSVQQIFADVFHAPAIFTMVFAAAASTMALAAFLNSRIVERIGTRRVSHSALLGFILVTGVHLLVAVLGRETIPIFAVLIALTMGTFALAASNFGAMAMEPVGHIAGTASSIQGFLSTVGGALIGLVIGQSFDGTVVPLTIGFFATGVASLGIVLVAERGRLFRPQHAPRPVTH